MNETQKAHPWAETRRMTYRSSKSAHVCGLGVSRSIKQKSIPKKPQHEFFTCLPRPPTLLKCHMDLHVWAHPRRGYISKFHRNPFRGFGAPGGQNLAFLITLAIRFYNSLYYRTSRDVNKDRGVKNKAKATDPRPRPRMRKYFFSKCRS